MANHKAARSLRASAVVGAALAACAALLLAVVGSGVAGAYTPYAPGKTATSKNSIVTAICKMTIQSVNASTGQVTIRLAAQAKPTTLAGYTTNVYTQAFCWVNSTTTNVIAYNNPFANGPVVPNTAITTAVDYSPNYSVCAQAYARLNSGADTLTTAVCSS